MNRFAIILGLLGLTGAIAPAALAGHDSKDRPDRGATADRLRTLGTEIEDYRSATGELPATVEGVEIVASNPDMLFDPWGHPIRYIRIAGGYWLLSWGADGLPGGEGDDADVVHIGR